MTAQKLPCQLDINIQGVMSNRSARNLREKIRCYNFKIWTKKRHSLALKGRTTYREAAKVLRLQKGVIFAICELTAIGGTYGAERTI